MVLRRFYLCTAFVLSTFGAGSVLAQTDLITNGSFESGLAGWTVAPSTGNPASATVSCSFNATTALGTETQTGTAALPPSAGSNLAMGSIRGNGNGVGGGNSSCVLYQDVVVPAGVTAATLNLKWGLKKLGVPNNSAAISARVFNTTETVPFFSQTGILNAGSGIVQFPVDSAVLVPATSGTVTTSALAGRTVRVALFIEMTVPTSTTPIQIAAGFDEVELLVNVPLNISIGFGASSLYIGGSTSLTYTLTNPPSGSPPVTSVGFTNTLPAGLVVATPNNLTGSCGGGTISATPGSSTISLSGGTLAAGASCTFSVDVVATVSVRLWPSRFGKA